jgi:diguanylate cyclase (GGDEF)-like protein
LIEEIEKTVDIVTQQEIQKSFIFIDVDRFSKKVKNTFSITDTDKLLKSISRAIAMHYDGDNFISRVSDHTFAIICDEHDTEELTSHAKVLCKKVANHIFEVDHKTIQFTFSIGICLINESIKNSQVLINHALESIEKLRTEQNGNGVDLYQKQTENGEVLASSFKKALKNNDFKLLFQPIISLRGEETERYEIFLRMNVEGKEITPPSFLSTAEDLGLSTKIDRWVILESIKNLQSTTQKTQHFINITASSMQDKTLIPWIKTALDAGNIEASSIVLQAKEADIIQQLTTVKNFIDTAEKIGIAFCITNFGSAAIDPLSTLDHINTTHIKIDGALALELQENPEKSQDLEELIQKLHEKGKITTIPHVEKASILSKLWQFGVHYIQGNYLQVPSSEMDYEFSSED